MIIDSDTEAEEVTTPASLAHTPMATSSLLETMYHGIHLNARNNLSTDTFQCNSLAMLGHLRPSDIDRLNYGGLNDVEEGSVLLFRVTDENGEHKTHAGLADQTCEEGHAYLPYWMMQTLKLNEGALINVRMVNLPKCKLVEFEWQDEAFLDITDPRAVLERALKSYFTLTPGDTIGISYNNRVYDLRVVRIRPEAAGFRAPPHYKEPSPASSTTTSVTSAGTVRIPELQPPPSVKEEATGFHRFTGVAQSSGRLNSTSSTSSSIASSSTPVNPQLDSNNKSDNVTSSSGIPPVLDVPFGRIFLGYPIIPYEDPLAVQSDTNTPKPKEFTGAAQAIRPSKKTNPKP
ncbi:ubiquitin fusion degradation protein UFD1-domain-containing protein [Syncephalis plumigaleata]|nr:ubiquitin fusion degradation protein UFD1-domain-containing protein [Syncephalis plumigaleata]